MLSCREVTRLVSERQERSLSVKERLALQMHVVVCRACKNFSLQVPFLSQAMRGYAQRVDTVLEQPPAHPQSSEDAGKG